jgi:hypothetical protein
MNISRFARCLLALFVSAALASPMIHAYDKGKGKAKGKAKHEDKDKEKPPSSGGHDRDDDRDDDHGDGGMRFRGMDANGDGRITRREWRGNDNSFSNHDCNHDGVLSGNEVRPGGDCSVNQPPSSGHPHPLPPSTGRNSSTSERAARFRELDVNHDRYITLGEWSGGTRSDFDAFDLNHDGRLSYDELVNRR